MTTDAEPVAIVYATFPSLAEAERIGGELVGRGLAACVNILPGMVSHYWWEGKVERGQEVVMFIKTRASFSDRVRKAVKASHPYSTPAILVIPVEMVEDTYLRWIMRETDRTAMV